MSLPTCTAAIIHIPQPLKPATLTPPPHHTQSSCTFSNPTHCSKHLCLTHSNEQIDPTVAWTSSIGRYAKNGQIAEAATQFLRMRLAGVEPNHVTFVTLLSFFADFPTYGSNFGASVHGYCRKLGLDTNDVIVGTAIVQMYAKCGRLGLARALFDRMGMRNLMTWNTMIDGYMRNGEIEDAIGLFDQMPERNAISWTALINGFVKKDYYEEALECFREMQLSGLEPDYVSIIAVVAACANLEALSIGLWTNRLVIKYGLCDNVKICNSLIDMYSRCGCMEFASQIFEKMHNRTLVSWTSLIVGFAINGYANEALELFHSLQNEGFKPNSISFTGALTACSHAGLVDQGLQIFDSMKSIHGITPRVEHYGCIVDLYSRAGRLVDALNVVKNMPMKPNGIVLGSLLAACRTQGDVVLGERLMEYLYELDPGGDSNYVLLANIYASLSRWERGSQIRRTMKYRGIEKSPGYSTIEIDASVYNFMSGDKSHEDTEFIYEMLELLAFELKLCGYVPETSVKYSNGEY